MKADYMWSVGLIKWLSVFVFSQFDTMVLVSDLIVSEFWSPSDISLVGPHLADGKLASTSSKSDISSARPWHWRMSKEASWLILMPQVGGLVYSQCPKRPNFPKPGSTNSTKTVGGTVNVQAKPHRGQRLLKGVKMKNCGQNDNVEYQVFDASGKSLKLVKDRDGRWNMWKV